MYVSRIETHTFLLIHHCILVADFVNLLNVSNFRKKLPTGLAVNF